MACVTWKPIREPRDNVDGEVVEQMLFLGFIRNFCKTRLMGLSLLIMTEDF